MRAITREDVNHGSRGDVDRIRKHGPPHQATGYRRGAICCIVWIRGPKHINFSALRGLMKDQSRRIRARGKLVGTVPVPRSSDYIGHRLQAAAALAQMLKIVAARAVDEQNVGL